MDSPLTHLQAHQPRATRLPWADARTPQGVVPATETQERLRILVFVALGSFATVGILAWLIPLISPPSNAITVGMGILAVKVMILCSGMLYLLRHQRSVSTLRVLGVGFVVLVATAMAVAEVVLSPAIGAARWGVSGIGIWIVLFPLVYPCSPRTTLIAALGCASAVPVVYGLSLLIGLPEVPLERLFPWLLPLYFCAGLAVVAAASIHRYRTALAVARKELRDLGRYTLVRQLGEGGMGVVWLAQHRLLPRSAAIKFISPPPKDDPTRRSEMTKQFEAEAAAIARLSSVHTVTLYDFGVSDEGEWYYVMELLDGIDLQHAVEAWGPFPDWRVARILAQACRSLAEAHGQGLVHRDIKPGNLMLCRLGGEFDVIKVVDFGLVGLAPSGTPDQPSTTWAGTGGYVAPEILLGTSTTSDGRSDLYALGCVAWWLLTGRMVFPAAKDLQEECVLHCTQAPPVLRLRGVGVDAGLVELVLALLAKRPEERPATADAVRHRLTTLDCWRVYDEPAVIDWWSATHTAATQTAATQVPAAAAPV